MSTIPSTTPVIVEASIEVLDHPAAGHRSAHIRTGIFPIIHAVGIKRELLDKHWWLTASVYEAFRQAKRLAEAEFGESAALKIGLPRINAEFEETSRIMGKDFWPCGWHKTTRHSPPWRDTRTNRTWPPGCSLWKRCLAEGNASETNV